MQVELTGGATGRVSGYADQLVRAWGAGRKAETLKYGTSGVVNQLWDFSHGAGGGGWIRTTTVGGMFETKVSYTCESAYVDFTIKPAAAAAGQPQSVVKVYTQGAD